VRTSERFHFFDAAVMVLRRDGYDGLICDPAAHECDGCGFDLISPDRCLNPDCHGGYAWELMDGRTVYKDRRQAP
jgi:hypothetical protein